MPAPYNEIVLHRPWSSLFLSDSGILDVQSVKTYPQDASWRQIEPQTQGDQKSIRDNKKWTCCISGKLWYYMGFIEPMYFVKPNLYKFYCTGIILGMGWANERRRYILTSSLIGYAHTQNDPCCTSGIISLILRMGIANERWHNIVMLSLLGYQLWYWLYRMSMSLSSLKNNFNSLCHFSVVKLQ